MTKFVLTKNIESPIVELEYFDASGTAWKKEK